jgi:hypothetical protein
MTLLTYADLNKFNLPGIREICTYNRDHIYNFNSLKKNQMINLLIAKSNEGYEIVIPKFVLNNDKYVKLNNVSKSYIRITLKIYIN